MRTPSRRSVSLLALALAGPVLFAAAGCCRKAPAKDTPTTTTPKAPGPASAASVSAGTLLTGKAALGDWTTDAPGVRRKVTTADLPPPYDTKSVDNGPKLVSRAKGALPVAPAGFRVSLYAEEMVNPRMIRAAPNGDLYVVESKVNRVRMLRAGKDGTYGDGLRDAKAEPFVDDLDQPFGIAFYPPGDAPRWVYVANTGSVVRYPYRDGAPAKKEEREIVVADLSAGGQLRGGGHWTRDVVFSRDGSKMYVSVGSKSNVGDSEVEARRARIFEFTPDGKNERVYATGIRNPVGLAIHPTTGDLWTSVNERDELGDHLVPDYVTRVVDGGFYGWPWFYLGPNQDPRHEGKHPELRDKVQVPDVLLQSHSASLGMTFLRPSSPWPEAYRTSAFAAEHGSWNRTRRTGYKVVQIPTKDGAASGEYVDFLTGFVTPEGDAWGRPVAVAEGKDGSLFVTDDGGNCVWRVVPPTLLPADEGTRVRAFPRPIWPAPARCRPARRVGSRLPGSRRGTRRARPHLRRRARRVRGAARRSASRRGDAGASLRQWTSACGRSPGTP